MFEIRFEKRRTFETKMRSVKKVGPFNHNDLFLNQIRSSRNYICGTPLVERDFNFHKEFHLELLRHDQRQNLTDVESDHANTGSIFKTG